VEAEVEAEVQPPVQVGEAEVVGAACSFATLVHSIYTFVYPLQRYSHLVLVLHYFPPSSFQ
jgi:hypothetical protein